MTRLRRPATTRALALPALSLWALLLPEAAAACAVCGGAGTEETRIAFLLTTVFLSVLPPAIVGGIVLWIWRRARAQQEAPVATPRASDGARASSATAAP